MRFVILASCSRSTADKYFWTRNLLSSSNTCALVNSTRRFVFDFVELLFVVSLMEMVESPLAEKIIIRCSFLFSS